ncbi:hypothetical protein E2P84_43980 [Burkholderia cepacia]|uniref:Intracellular multiplication protein IcmB n=1 Tax=Burkholderia cepacia TaxID=292 RepID=A0AAX2RMP5_BURCE|nr:hypothetical protein [Burkholderia cepacia]TES60891.1 hypothetical protein E2P84_43980 [Burkholderia cepacia]TET01663.1 hypothetical protein E3D36_16645 [Burkholderia cepacia]TEU47521.1 hypothetical protein E3D37_16075 [Burkholderia cepacia]TEU53548.1 hypothetical protein E3D38_12465 [Burkholderia cepacia]TEV02154.1 hypothetical protein E3D40_13395 [Burkholderia cepacia]
MFQTSDYLIGKIKSQLLKEDVSAYSTLNTYYDEHTFLLDDGGLMTLLQYHGSTALAGSEEGVRQRGAVYSKIKQAFSTGEHRWQIVFENDPEGAKEDLARAYAPIRSNAAKIGLDVDDLIDAQEEFLGQMVHRERCYWAIYTRPATLSKELRKQIQKRRAEAQKETFVPLAMAQNPTKAIEELARTHLALIASIVQDLPRVGFHLEKLTIADAMRAMRLSVDGRLMSENWAPRLAGATPDLKNFRAAPSIFGDQSHFMPPPLAYQLSPSKVELVEHEDFSSQRLIKVGRRYVSNMAMHLGPEDPASFLFLLRRTINLPWRVSFDVSPHGLQQLGLRGMLVKLAGFLKANRPMKLAMDEIQARADQGDPDCAFRVSACTWADDPEALVTNHGTLMRAFSEWGHTEMTDWLGDEAEAWLSTIPGFGNAKAGVTHAVNLSDLIELLPFARPTSPWKRPMFMMRSGDCKLLNFNTGTSEQKSWDDIVFAAMGSGKSAFVNSYALWLAMSQGGVDLPLMLIADIGPSSRGTIQTLKDRLPEHLKHKVAYYQLENSEENTINAFDLTPGLREPNTMQKDMLVYLLLIVMTPAGQEADRNVEELAKVLIDVAYAQCAAPATAKPYSANVEQLVDLALEKIQFERGGRRHTWYEIGDLLFRNGYVHECTLAYRYAVPVLSDMINAMKDARVQDLFNRDDGVAKVNDGSETLLTSAMRGISAASADLRLLDGPTRLDIGDTRVLAVNLDLLAKGDARRAALMYVLTRDLLARRAYVTEQTVKMVMPEYRDWAQRLYEMNRRELKVFIYDEFHRTKGITALRKLIKMDVREGRKWKIKTVLLSQMMEDFDEELVDLAANIFILGTDDAAQAAALVKKFGLSEAAHDALINSVTGPTARGAPMLGIFKVKEGSGGKYVQVLYNSLCAQILWSLTTDPDEDSLKTALEKRVGTKEANRLLSRYYRGGAKDAVQQRRLASTSRIDNSIEQMAVEMVQAAQRERGLAA